MITSYLVINGRPSTGNSTKINGLRTSKTSNQEPQEDQRPYSTVNSIEEVIQKLENAAKKIFSGLVITK